MYSKDIAKHAHILLTITEPWSNPEFPQEQRTNYHAWKGRVFLHCHTTWKVMPRSVWNDIADWRTKPLSNCIGDILDVCSQIVQKCLCLTRIGRPEILWSVNKLVCAITKLTCDKRLACLISYTHRHVNTNNIVMWETLHNNVDWDYFKVLILQEALKIRRNPLQVEHCSYLEVTHLFQ